MDITETLSVLELLIIIMGLPGLTVSLLLIAVFQGQRSNVRRAKVNGINKRMAGADLRNELLALYRMAGYITFGLVFAIVQPPILESVGVAALAVSCITLSWEVIETVGSMWRYRDFRKNRDAVREEAVQRHDTRDMARDAGRDPIRDEARDEARDKEVGDLAPASHADTLTEGSTLRLVDPILVVEGSVEVTPKNGNGNTKGGTT